MAEPIRDEEHCTCPWPVVQYVCPFDPSVEHWELTLFAHVPLSVAERRVLQHIARDHKGIGYAISLSTLRLAQTSVRTLQGKDGLVTGAYAQVEAMTHNANLKNGEFDILLAQQAQD